MRKVNYKEYVKDETGVKGWALETQKEAAIFHRWGVDYERFETGAGNFSTAIIELPNGTIKNIPAHHIVFIKEVGNE